MHRVAPNISLPYRDLTQWFIVLISSGDFKGTGIPVRTDKLRRYQNGKNVEITVEKKFYFSYNIY